MLVVAIANQRAQQPTAINPGALGRVHTHLCPLKKQASDRTLTRYVFSRELIAPPNSQEKLKIERQDDCSDPDVVIFVIVFWVEDANKTWSEENTYFLSFRVCS